MKTLLRAPSFVLCLLIAGSLVLLLLARHRLPTEVAVQFDVDHRAARYLARDTYMMVTAALMLALPPMLALLCAWAARALARSPNAPRYWFGPEHRAQSVAELARHGYRLGYLAIVFLLGLHSVILEGNATTPAQLPVLRFWLVVAAFLVLFAVWLRGYNRYLRPPPGESA